MRASMPLLSMDTDHGPLPVRRATPARPVPLLHVAPRAVAASTPIVVVAGSAALGAGLEAWLAGARDGWAVEVVVADRGVPHGALHPDLALMVVAVSAGAENLVGAVHGLAPDVAVLALSEGGDPALDAALLRAGATGVLDAAAGREELVRAAEDVVAGRAVMSAEALRHVVQGPPPFPHLTERQRDVLRLLAEGRTTREIARRLVVAESTVKTHVARLASRLELAGRAELQRSAAGLLERAGSQPTSATWVRRRVL